MSIKFYLHLPRLHIQNANAQSSTLTVGFPAVTAWLGAIHALERRLNQTGYDALRLTGVAIACHDFTPQLYKGGRDIRYSIVGTANPLKKKGAGFERPPFIEEPRCHLTVSLLVEVTGLGRINEEGEEKFIADTAAILHQLKFAGGDVLDFRSPVLQKIDVDSDKDIRALIRLLMPGYVLIERRDLLPQTRPEDGDMLDALLGALSVEYTAKESQNGQEIEWEAHRQQAGWIVPIAVGFKDISGAVRVNNQRSYDYEHHFAELVVTLGEFRMAHRFNSIGEILWEYSPDLSQGLYVCGIRGNNKKG